MRYRVEKIPRGLGCDVFFAFSLQGVVALFEGETIGSAVRRASQIVRALFIPALDCGFELLAYNPGTGIGPLSLVLRVRVSALTEAEAIEKARATAAALSAILNLGNRWYWVPAEAEGADLFPFLPAGSSLYNINRCASLTERTASVDSPSDLSANSPEQRTRPGAAVNRGAMKMTVDPFLPQSDPLGRILRLLSASGRCPALVSISISPVELYDREIQLLAPAECNSMEESLEEELSETAGRRMSLKESAFLLRVAFLCAEQGTQAALLAQSVGASLSASVDNFLRAGGFEARRVEEPDIATALAELRRISFPSKPPLPGKPGWERLPALVSSQEAGMVFRFPASPCPGVPQRRPMAPLTIAPAAEGTLIGTAVGSGGEQVPVRITPADRRSILLVGASGSGKSQFMLATVLQDIADNHGLCLLDPHGDLYSRVLANIPAARRKDVIAFDCTLPEPGFSFNLLAHSSEQERDRIVESFMEIFGQLFDLKLTGGPIFEMYFRSALTLVMCDSKATLADFMKFFQDRDYRRYCIGLCKDEFVSAAWERIVATAGGDLSLGNVAPYVVSKMSPFLFNRQTRGIVSCRETTLDFNAAVRERKIVLVNLGKGTIGNLAASFIGMLFIEKVLRAAMNPGNIQQAGRNFYLAVDEFQNLATHGAAEALAEGRKYQIGCLLSLQFLGQLPGNVLKAALGNASAVLAMRLGPDDADLLAEYFKPAFSKSDLLSLEVGTAATSVTFSGAKAPPFLLSTTHGLGLTASLPIPAYGNVEDGAKGRGCGKRSRKCPGTAVKPTRLPSTGTE